MYADRRPGETLEAAAVGQPQRDGVDAGPAVSVAHVRSPAVDASVLAEVPGLPDRVAGRVLAREVDAVADRDVVRGVGVNPCAQLAGNRGRRGPRGAGSLDA